MILINHTVNCAHTTGTLAERVL